MLRRGLGWCPSGTAGTLTCGNGGGGYVHGAQDINCGIEIISETSTSDQEFVCLCELYVICRIMLGER